MRRDVGFEGLEELVHGRVAGVLREIDNVRDRRECERVLLDGFAEREEIPNEILLVRD